jgi:hypothetical protein
LAGNERAAILTDTAATVSLSTGDGPSHRSYASVFPLAWIVKDPARNNFPFFGDLPLPLICSRSAALSIAACRADQPEGVPHGCGASAEEQEAPSADPARQARSARGEPTGERANPGRLALGLQAKQDCVARQVAAVGRPADSRRPGARTSSAKGAQICSRQICL